jgi:hypothetical protein
LTALNVARFRCRRRSDWRARLIVDLWITGIAHLLGLKCELLSYGIRHGQVDALPGTGLNLQMLAHYPLHADGGQGVYCQLVERNDRCDAAD